jgi:serine/threonine-protein kinase
VSRRTNRDRFLHESELAASIDHPNIVPIYEAGRADDLLFIAMRFVEGGDLRERLRRGRPEPAETIGLLVEVASALDVAHARGLVHRDVKPSNVLLDTGARPDGSDHVYLADFGITKRITEGPRLGDDGRLMGTTTSPPSRSPVRRSTDGRTSTRSAACSTNVSSGSRRFGAIRSWRLCSRTSNRSRRHQAISAPSCRHRSTA